MNATQVAPASVTLYGIAQFGAEGYAIFWNGRYEDRRYPTREAAFLELMKRDRAERFVEAAS